MYILRKVRQGGIGRAAEEAVVIEGSEWRGGSKWRGAGGAVARAEMLERWRRGIQGRKRVEAWASIWGVKVGRGNSGMDRACCQGTKEGQ